ncbi:MAG: metallophosphoesterase [Syntrophomonadaceae bacterium]|nr:metallophosphoesterase [Syntrophomonadaceae bacterium]
MHKHLKIAVTIGLLAVFLYCAFYNGLVVRKYSVNTGKLNEDQSIRIVLIADLHNHIYGPGQSELVQLIKEQEPDIIALAGDIADIQAPLTGTEMLLKGIQGVAPVYYVSGNHEYWSNDIRQIKDTIRKNGVTILEGSYDKISINNAAIIIAGVDDPEAVRYKKRGTNWEEGFCRAFNGLGEEPAYKVLLAHRPELIEVYKQGDFDLVLSGHTHGGQVRIPFILNGLYAPNQGWFPPYAGGMYDHGSLIHIVSRGVSFNPLLPRIFNPPEVVVIDIEGDRSIQP